MFPNEVLGFGVDSNVVQNMDESFTKDVYHHMSQAPQDVLEPYKPTIQWFPTFQSTISKIFSGEGKQGKPSQFDQFSDPSKIHVSIIFYKGAYKETISNNQLISSIYCIYIHIFIYISTYLYLYIKIPMFFFHVFGTSGEALMNSILQGDVE